MDPAMMGGGGMPPMDPAMMGGGGMPPMDPAMMGGMPPMDPAMMGGMPPPPPPPPAPGGPSGAPDIASIVSQAVQQAMQNNGGIAGPAQAAGGKPPKPDINMVATDVFQIKKLLQDLYNRNGWPLPEGILDGPGRDPMTGMPTASPMGGSDPAGSPPPGPPPESAISPIGPMEGAFPTPGQGKSAQANHPPVGSSFAPTESFASRAQAVARLFQRRKQHVA